MDLDELQSVQSRERQTDSLQQLRASFYKEAGEFLETLRAQREQAADRADDPWNSPEVSRLSDDIETAEQTVEAIYERRVGKVVKMASLAAADMPTEDDGLTEEEEQLFETLVGSIEENRSRVEAVLGGENPAMVHDETQADDSAAVSETPPADGATRAETGRSEPGTGEPEESVDAADLMGGGPVSDGDERAPSSGKSETEKQTPPPEPPAETTPTSPDSAHPPGERDSDTRTGPADESTTGGPASEAGTASPNSESPVGSQASDQRAGADIDRETVRIKSEVGEIYGVDDRSYELSADDVVSLPAANATPLLEDDAAERLE